MNHDFDDLLSAKEACAFFGGKGRPIHVATLYRGVRRGIYPAPIRIGLRMTRWRKSECVAALQKLALGTGA